MKKICLLGAIFVTSISLLHADESAEIEQLRASLAISMPDLEISSIAASPVPGLLELVSGAQLVYITPDGKYVIEGSIIDIGRRINLTQQRKGKTQLAAINAMGEENMLIFRPAAAQDKNRSITVFTDTSCGYCQKLHREINGLLSQGVSVRYLLYPRAGLNSDTHRQLESVWCADDPQRAMTMAKSGQSIPEKSCDNPIREHIAFAQQVGLQGTPMIFLDNGLVIPGYRPASELVKLLASEPRI
jgi:thiol:disulfide interchange protein DsbC